jgi:hypothetical protein
MKQMLAALTLALLLALVVVTGVASASHNDQPNPPYDFATGAGKVSTPNFFGFAVKNKFSFTAHDEDASGFTPEARNGQYHAEGNVFFVEGTDAPFFSQSVDVQGRVTCLRVFGNQAYFGGPIKKSSNPAFEGRFAFFDVVDNDQPPGNPATPDQFLFEFILLNPICLEPISGVPMTSGNIVVHDGQPNSPGPPVAGAQAPTEEEALQERRDLGLELGPLGTE